MERGGVCDNGDKQDRAEGTLTRELHTGGRDGAKQKAERKEAGLMQCHIHALNVLNEQNYWRLSECENVLVHT